MVHKIPNLLETILNLILPADDYQNLKGDYVEIYNMMCLEKGKISANFWLCKQLFKGLWVYLYDSIYWRTAMFKNYFKSAVRNLKNNRTYSFINIIGLSVGMACCIIVLLWVGNEMSYDTFHRNKDQIYRIVSEETHREHPQAFAVTPPPLASTLKREYADIIAATNFSGTGMRLLQGEKSFYERGCLADPDFLQIFTFPFEKGDPKTALSEKLSIVISRGIAEKYFNQKDPMGRTLTTVNGTDLKVTGVLQDISRNSHLHFDFILPFSILGSRRVQNWRDVSYHTYVMLQKDASIEHVTRKLNECFKQYRPKDTDYNYLQPLKLIHRQSHFIFDIAGHIDMKYIYIFSFTSILILIIACINFMSLSTACSGKRAREVGVRKVVGANRIDAILQFFSEAIFFSFLALVIAFLLVQLFLPLFNTLAGTQLNLNVLKNMHIILWFAAIALFTGIVSGSYPALLFSSFRPINVVKNITYAGKQGSLFRKVLVILQFSLSTILIVCTLTVFQQLFFMKNANQGYDKENVIFFEMSNEVGKKYKTVKTELLKNPNILNITAVHSPPIYESSGTSSLVWEGRPSDVRLQVRLQSVDEDFLKTFNVKMAKGRFFSGKGISDTSKRFIVNETAAKAMGLKDPLGKWLKLNEKDKHKGQIIGVIKDYQLRSLRHVIEPMVMMANPKWLNWFCLKISSENTRKTIRYIEKIWKEFSPRYPFNFHFMDQAINALYQSEEKLGTIFRYATFLAIFISLLGLFGLASYLSEQRTKEIGIRKVLGASVSKIYILLSKEFAHCIAAAIVIAWPIAYWIMKHWLLNFSVQWELGCTSDLWREVLSKLHPKIVQNHPLHPKVP